MTNGFSSIFMVASVSAAPVLRKTGRDDPGISGSGFQKKSGAGLFSNILKETMDQYTEDAVDCRTTTYGRDRKMQTFLYQTREYHY